MYILSLCISDIGLYDKYKNDKEYDEYFNHVRKKIQVHCTFY